MNMSIKKTILATLIVTAILSGCSTTTPITQNITEPAVMQSKNIKSTEPFTFIVNTSQSFINRLNNNGNNLEGGLNYFNLSLNDSKIIFDLDSDKIDFSKLNKNYNFYYKFSDLEEHVKHIIKKDATEDEYNQLLIITMRANIVNYFKNLYDDKTGLFLTEIKKDNIDVYSNIVNQIFALSAYEAKIDFNKQKENISKSKNKKQQPENNINHILLNNIQLITYQAIYSLALDSVNAKKPFCLNEETSKYISQIENSFKKDVNLFSMIQKEYILQQNMLMSEIE